ncbi:MAG: Ppx/GppA family phosphatase [Acidobacteria bacterium]|nr:Ppx/GppA family phosphatase [Acidobacteriota bacterium]
MKLAAIDIGSNSIKLVVVDAAASDSFAVLTREKETVRLGHETLREGFLSAAAISRAADCINRFRSIAEARGVEQTIAIATASVREASNAREFIEEIERQTGVRVDVLSGVEEARLIGVAAAQGCAPRGSALVNIDIGGGSTEISVMNDGTPAALFSVKLGAVGLTERFITSDPVKPKELRALKDEIRAALDRPRRELRGHTWQHATGTSGTIIAIGESLRARLESDKTKGATGGGARPSGAEVAAGELRKFNERVAALTVEERRDLPGISAQRSEIVVAGGQILEGVMRALEIDALHSCDYALREGVIIDYLREIEDEARPPVPDIADQKLRGVHAVGRRFGYEEEHAQLVAKFAERIFDALAPAYGFTRQHRTLLAAAALLHDVGYHIAHESHHKHTLYLIKHSELTGFSESERNVIANIARYHRGATPKDRHPDFVALHPRDRELVQELSAILRVADALDRRHEGRVRDIKCATESQSFHIQLLSAAGRKCDQELWAAERKSEPFEEVFERQLIFSQRPTARRV